MGRWSMTQGGIGEIETWPRVPESMGRFHGGGGAWESLCRNFRGREIRTKKTGGSLRRNPPVWHGLNHASKLMSDYFPRLARFQTIKPKPILLTASPML